MDERPPILQNAPLRIVAVELRFPDTVLLPEDLKKIRKELAKDYPASDTEQGFGIELSVQGMRQQGTVQRYVYRSRDGSHQVALTSTSVVLEARAGYEGFHHFLARWLDVLAAVEPALELDTQIRLGLRYVNQLVIEDASRGLEAAVGRVNPSLLSPFGTDGFDHSVTSSLQELRLANERGKATLRHGLQIAQDENGGAPAGVYVLDIDFYDDELSDYDNHRHRESLKMFNSEIWRLFRWSITDDEYERMDPQERDDTDR
jgi:uncharacterized protein (TIGR04255 family)